MVAQRQLFSDRDEDRRAAQIQHDPAHVWDERDPRAAAAGLEAGAVEDPGRDAGACHGRGRQLDPLGPAGLGPGDQVLPAAARPAEAIQRHPVVRQVFRDAVAVRDGVWQDLKAELGAGTVLPEEGRVFISIKDMYKTAEMAEAARGLLALGFQIAALGPRHGHLRQEDPIDQEREIVVAVVLRSLRWRRRSQAWMGVVYVAGGLSLMGKGMIGPGIIGLLILLQLGYWLSNGGWRRIRDRAERSEAN